VKLRTFFLRFYVFFQNPKKHDFLRFFEWLTTFSRTLVLPAINLNIFRRRVKTRLFTAAFGDN